ncbi:hypothetical protein L596_023626 [Steinernema carpocapsae]|uniref:Uncharacterized protein n=1 Tax=Steinernema carpocapsae TaxID=34508 RepID=A0A4U5ME73_STECR|nr:hypothetical protein L596_023626 [Steinernema carpocapsae]
MAATIRDHVVEICGAIKDLKKAEVEPEKQRIANEQALLFRHHMSTMGSMKDKTKALIDQQPLDQSTHVNLDKLKREVEEMTQIFEYRGVNVVIKLMKSDDQQTGGNEKVFKENKQKLLEVLTISSKGSVFVNIDPSSADASISNLRKTGNFHLTAVLVFGDISTTCQVSLGLKTLTAVKTLRVGIPAAHRYQNYLVTAVFAM